MILCRKATIFLNVQSTRRHSVAAKHCSRIVLKVFDGLLPPITPPDHKNRINERCSSLKQTESGVAMTNGEAATMELA
jgi:hypothetical protein